MIKGKEHEFDSSLTALVVDPEHNYVRETAADDFRQVNLGSEQKEKFVTNEVKTSKYSLLTWAPLSLIFQFRRAANVYFLIISILTAMPFSPKNPLSMAGTFGAVLVFTMLKEAYEDFFRHKADLKINSAKVRRVNGNAIELIEARHVNVGDILEFNDGDAFPADLVLLSSSHDDGLAFINTMNLDGETNLKERVALKSTKSFNCLERLESLRCEVLCDQPSMALHKWNCKIRLDDTWEPMGMLQLLLRGCVLKSTDRAYGLVVYTGADTKIVMNSKKAPSKVSNVMKMMNKILYTVFGFQAFICLLFGGLSVAWQNSYASDHSYLDLDTNAGAGIYFIKVLTFLVAYSHLIPISLYVTLEVVKLALGYLIKNDLDMYYEADDKAANVRTSDLIEELGQVEFVFSDKTGTLTSNVMEFKKCFIRNTVYGFGETILDYGVGEDLRPAQILEDRSHPDHKFVLNFFTVLSVCHSVFPKKDDKEPNGVKYQAASPDELALVKGAAQAGMIFVDKVQDNISVKYRNQPPTRWEVLAEIPFNSDRKRMSLIVKHPFTGKLMLMTKGADTVMKPLLKQDGTNQEMIMTLDGFAVEGLRTLILSQREVSEQEFSMWISGWNSLLMSNSKEKEELMNAHGATIEKNLDLVGVSAIEDKLQDEVPETIDLLMRAGIRVWVLTGDKEETAIEIGKACNLIKEHMTLANLSSESEEEFERKLHQRIQEFELEDKDIKRLEAMGKDAFKPLTIVINGATLVWALDRSLKHRESFFKLGFISNSCICCRVTPAQKMQVVGLAKERGTWITLSIGDGANDVSMIQEAHIGVGVMGKEGTQAVQSSDYAIAQFKFLKKLILVHGRLGYRRICWFICYYFYKNITVVFTEIWFAFFNGFSGQIYFLDWLPMLYNSFFTSWPCMFTYVLEQDVNAQFTYANPEIYGAGQKRIYFTFLGFWKWIMFAVIHGGLCYAVPMLEFSTQAKDKDGLDGGLWFISTISFTLVIIIVTVKLLMESCYWNKVNL
jgi:phospholipid-transporting ATPase